MLRNLSVYHADNSWFFYFPSIDDNVEESKVERSAYVSSVIASPDQFLFGDRSLSLYLLHTINTRDELIIKPYLSLAYRAYC